MERDPESSTATVVARFFGTGRHSPATEPAGTGVDTSDDASGAAIAALVPPPPLPSAPPVSRTAAESSVRESKEAMAGAGAAVAAGFSSAHLTGDPGSARPAISTAVTPSARIIFTQLPLSDLVAFDDPAKKVTVCLKAYRNVLRLSLSYGAAIYPLLKSSFDAYLRLNPLIKSLPMGVTSYSMKAGNNGLCCAIGPECTHVDYWFRAEAHSLSSAEATLFVNACFTKLGMISRDVASDLTIITPDTIADDTEIMLIPNQETSLIKAWDCMHAFTRRSALIVSSHGEIFDKVLVPLAAAAPSRRVVLGGFTAGSGGDPAPPSSSLGFSSR